MKRIRKCNNYFKNYNHPIDYIMEQNSDKPLLVVGVSGKKGFSTRKRMIGKMKKDNKSQCDKMKRRLTLVNNSFDKTISGLLEELAEACYMDKTTGEFHCRKCKNIVHIDLSRHYAFCPVDGRLI